jgi:hypothetical protein
VNTAKPDRVIILTNYARPWNLPRQVANCLALATPAEVILIDNSPGPNSNLPDMDLSAIRVLRDGRNRGAGYRFTYAAGLEQESVMCIDDDILPTATQIETLFRRQAREPDRPHGVWGEDMQESFGRLTFKTHLCGEDREVDILNRLYVFSSAQARRGLALAQALGFTSWEDVGLCEDVILSFSGARKPACHNVGPLESCASSDDPKIASWHKTGFFAYRVEIVRRLKALRGIPGVPPALLYRAPSL